MSKGRNLGRMVDNLQEVANWKGQTVAVFWQPDTLNDNNFFYGCRRKIHGNGAYWQETYDVEVEWVLPKTKELRY